LSPLISYILVLLDNDMSHTRTNGMTIEQLQMHYPGF